MLEVRKRFRISPSRTTSTWVRVSEGKKAFPLLVAKFKCVRVIIRASREVSRTHKAEKDKDFTGSFMEIQVAKRY